MSGLVIPAICSDHAPGDHRWKRWLFLLLIQCGLFASGYGAAQAMACLDCHSDESLTTEKDGKEISLFVDAAKLGNSAHDSLECTDCHEGLDPDSLPHADPMKAVSCLDCHENNDTSHAFHSLVKGSAKDASCRSCHGSHDIARVESDTFPFRTPAGQAQACGQCHEDPARHYTASAHGRAAGESEKAAPDCLSCHRENVVAPKDTARTAEFKLAQARLCESCHADQPEVADKTLRGGSFVQSFDSSVHGAALHAGKSEAATCIDCHGAHDMNRAIMPGAWIGKTRQPSTCASCHKKEVEAYENSVHAAVLHKGGNDAPVCTDCHGEHDIKSPKDPSAPVNKRNLAEAVCAECHASLKLTRKYGLSADAFSTFSDSFHGLAVRGGAVEVVNCASCHGAHDIRSPEDPTSSVHKANLVQTCGQCHPGANDRFAIGSVHVSPENRDGGSNGDHILHLVSTLYTLLIIAVVGGMFGHNLLDFIKKSRRKLAIQKGVIEEEHVEHRLYLRMTVHERFQHGTLVISFVLLVVTGFMLRMPEAWWVVGIRNLSARAFEWRGVIHRMAGVVLLAAGFWHVVYLAFTRPGRSLLMDLLPRPRDFTDPWKVLLYNLGLRKTKPQFPRFSYIEKTEYWALVWGTLLMGVTGLLLWMGDTSMGLVTKLGFDIARTVHYYEAILATLAIIVWHFYFVIFNPDVYPMNLAWLTGRMSERELLEEHPLQLEQLKRDGKEHRLSDLE